MINIELMRFLKSRAAAQGITQKMIAEYFEVSIPTVKRWYSGIGLSLEQADRISQYLGISLGQALVSIQNTTDTFQYSHEQESFFAKNPNYLAFFDNLLRGRSVKQIQKKFSLNNMSTDKYLIKLDKLKLIELHPNNKVKLLQIGEPVWTSNGPLTRAFRKNIMDDFIATKSSLLDKFYLYEFSDEDLRLISIKLEELLQLTSRANNRAAANNIKNKAYGLNISLKEFNWSLDKFLQ
jgi:transcriptional regulator with XRE-family HTH domain